MVFCRDGVDMCGNLCRGAVPMDGVCRDAADMCPDPVVSPITATFTYAPTVGNPGGANPSLGTLTELLDVPPGVVGVELNKGIYAVVSDVQGGDGGPYTVDFSGLPWRLDQRDIDAAVDVDFSSAVVESWGLNMHLLAGTDPGLASTPTVVGTTSGTAPAAAVVSGVNAGTDFASYIPQTRSSGTSTSAELWFQHTVGPVSVTVTDGSGNMLTLTAPARIDSWLRPPSGP